MKTYPTSLGFFEQAIAAPLMKAALEARGADSNLFHQGAAKESWYDRDVIAETMAKPGVVFKRPVGSDGSFGEHAELPKDLVQSGTYQHATRPSRAAKIPPARTGTAENRKAARAYERERDRRAPEYAKEEAAQEKESERRRQAVIDAQASWDKAASKHNKRSTRLRAQVEAIEQKLQAEDADWDKEREVINAALRRARDFERLGDSTACGGITFSTDLSHAVALRGRKDEKRRH